MFVVWVSVQRASSLASLGPRAEKFEVRTGGVTVVIVTCSMPKYLTKMKFVIDFPMFPIVVWILWRTIHVFFLFLPWW